MQNDNNENRIEEANETENSQYIEALNSMKQMNEKLKAEKNAMKEENKKLLNSIVNGETIDKPAQKETIDIDKVRKELFGGQDMSNLEYAKKALELRNAIIEQGGEDPFIPQGHAISATAEDREAAQRVADVFEDCIDYAQGDPEAFTNELMRRTKNDKISQIRRR